MNTGAHVLSLDHAVDLQKIIQEIPKDIFVMGNIDPSEIMLRGTEDQVELAVMELLKAMDGHTNFILSTGCDLPPDTPINNIKAFMNIACAHNLMRRKRVS